MKKTCYEIPEENTAGVYAIINSVKKYCYIGQARERRDRCKNHLNSLKSGTHKNKLMQKHFNEGDKFLFLYLYDSNESAGNDERLMMESYFYCCLISAGIKTYNTENIKYAENYFLRACRCDPKTRRLLEAVRTGQ